MTAASLAATLQVRGHDKVMEPYRLPVVTAPGGPARATASARRSASGSRYRPAIRTRWRRRLRASRPQSRTGTHQRSAQGRHRVGRGAEPGLGHPRSPGCRAAHARPGRADRPGPDRRTRRRPAGPACSDPPGLRAAAGARAGRTRPAGRALPEDHRGAFGEHVREGGTSGQHGCRPGPPMPR